MTVAQLLQPPCPGVGDVEPTRQQQRLHVTRIAQEIARSRRRVPQHHCVALGPQSLGIGLVAWARPDRRADDALGDGPVHRQAVGGQFGTQQFGG